MPIMLGKQECTVYAGKEEVAGVYAGKELISKKVFTVSYAYKGNVFYTLELEEGSNAVTAFTPTAQQVPDFVGWSVIKNSIVKLNNYPVTQNVTLNAIYVAQKNVVIASQTFNDIQQTPICKAVSHLQIGATYKITGTIADSDSGARWAFITSPAKCGEFTTESPCSTTWVATSNNTSFCAGAGRRGSNAPTCTATMTGNILSV